MTAPFFNPAKPKVKDALAVLFLSSRPTSQAILHSRCSGLFQGPDGDTWINDSMGAAQRQMAIHAYRFLRDRLPA